MNKSYVSVWNEALGSWVAASENTVARGKRSKSRVVAGAVATAVVLAGLSGAASAAVLGTPAQATASTMSAVNDVNMKVEALSNSIESVAGTDPYVQIDGVGDGSDNASTQAGG